MNWSKWIRQFHRWVAMTFLATVVANFLAMAVGDVPDLVTYAPLPPLFVLMLSGLYMLVLPHVKRPR